MTRFDAIATHAAFNPSGEAIADLESGRRWSYGQLHAAIDRLACWLVNELGAASGARVATLSRNCAEMLILHIASVRAGAVFVPLNWRLAPAEIEALATDAQPQLLFHEAEFPVPRHVRVLPMTSLLSLGAAGTRPPPQARRAFDAIATLLYTSGTSGRPKGVMLSEQNSFWGCTNFISGNAVSTRSVFLCDMPLFHTAGLFAAARAPLHAGGRVLISRGFEPVKTIQRLGDPALGVTHYFSVPQMAATIWAHPGFEPSSLKGLVGWTIGGAPNPKALTQRFVTAGIHFTEGYGMSETGSNLGMPTHDLQVLMDKAGSCGLPFVAVQTRIVDAAGHDVPIGEVGELWMKGPSITTGYWNQPEATAKAFHDGWFMTGDAARMDADGFFYIVDRRKDMYISGGENVYPAEIEAALADHDQVRECAVVGVPDKRWGEVGRLYVIPAAGSRITGEDILAHCRARLARFKVPASAVITNVLPRTASGKVQKHLLRERALAELGSAQPQDGGER
jgi:fatty-acyl-CoA synthase